MEAVGCNQAQVGLQAGWLGNTHRHQYNQLYTHFVDGSENIFVNLF